LFASICTLIKRLNTVGIRDLCHVYDVALLSTNPLQGTGLESVGVLLQAEDTCEPERIRAVHAALGHRVAEPMMERRLANRLRFAVFLQAGTPVASTWLASGGRYIDELNWWLPVDAEELWLRDAFVAPAWRGRRLFSALVATLSCRKDKPARRIWSDVDWDNEGSMNAHKAAGFSVVARVRAIDLAGRIRIRSALPAWPLPVDELDPGARLIWLRGHRLRRHQELLA